jgi:hypothetical protein
MTRRCLARIPAVAIAAALALPAPVHASYTVTCESHGYRYQYCGANTNGHARLVNQTSSSPCVRGRSWGSDGGGVWVNSGCSGQFEVGGDSGGGSNAGAAIAAGVGIAILGSIIANQDRDSDNGFYQPSQPYPPPYPGGGFVPGWAIGSFSGTDTRGRPQTIRINPDGAVTVRYRNGGGDRGWFSGNTLTIGNRAMAVQPLRGGISVNGAYFGR